MNNPFVNDPFALVWEAFKNLFPDKWRANVIIDMFDGAPFIIKSDKEVKA